MHLTKTLNNFAILTKSSDTSSKANLNATDYKSSNEKKRAQAIDKHFWKS